MIDLQTDTLFFIFVIALQLVIVTIIGVSIRLRRLFRKQAQNLSEAVLKQWTEVITDQALGLNPDIKSLNIKTSAEKKFLQNTFIDIMSNLTGQSLANVVELYKKMGYLDHDHQDLSSQSKFEKTLKALSHVNIVQDRSSIEYVRPYLKNTNYYLRFSAIRFLIKNDIENLPQLDQEISWLLNQRRYDSLLELIAVLAVYQKDYFLNYFSKPVPQEILSLFLKVTQNLKIAEAMPLVRQSLKDLLNNDPDNVTFIKQHLLALTVSYSPETEGLFNALLIHQNTKIRYLSLCSLFIIRPDLKESIIQSISTEDKMGLEEAFQTFSLNIGKYIYG